MKYGLIVFNKTDNIGDDIQSYAAIQYLPRIDYYIDRENMDCFAPNEKQYVATIMNGWYLHDTYTWPPSPYIYPLLVSMFLVDDKYRRQERYLTDYGAEWLKKYGPVGCREKTTQEYLNSLDIDCYVTGCLTLTINKFPDVEKQDYICVVDLDEKLVEKLKQLTDKPIKQITHYVKPEESESLSYEERFKKVEEILKTYQGAQCVITSRLHVTSPCLALETPVMYIDNSSNLSQYDNERLRPFMELFNVYKPEDILEEKETIKTYLQNPLPNSDKYISIRESLKNKCKDFIENIQNANINEEELPDVEIYNDLVVKRGTFAKRIFKQYIKSQENYITELYNENVNLRKTLEEERTILKEGARLKQEVEELERQAQQNKEELEKIYNSKSWKIIRSYYKMLEKLNLGKDKNKNKTENVEDDSNKN